MVESIRSRAALIVLCFVASFAAGCKAPWRDDWKPSDMFSLQSTWPFGDDEDDPKTPTRLVGSWTDTVLHQPGKKPQRGFGGRLIFFGKEDGVPILVEGQLVVYAFDESNREPTDNKPTRRYVFPAEQFPRHMSKSEIGPSYSFWLPWDEDGGPQTEISLIARFEPKEGSIVVGEQTKHLLPGKLSPADLVATAQSSKVPEGVPMRPAMPQLAMATEAAAPVASDIQQASYEAAAPPSPSPQRRMTTTSISLPENFGRRIGTAAPANTTPTLPQPPQPQAQTAPPQAMPMASTAVAARAPTAQPTFAGLNQNVPPEFRRMPLQSQYQPMPQSPFAGQASFSAGPPTVPEGYEPLPANAQRLGAQLPVSAAESKWMTTVSYSPPVEAAVGQVVPVGPGQPLPAGSQLQPRPAPSLPAVR